MFEITSHSGSLKETAQGGQDLIWHRKGKSIERRFQLTNVSIAFLRSETGGQIKMTFSCNITSFGYSVEEARLNVIVRSKGGAALHTWSIAIAVKCEDKNQSLTPLTQVVPTDVGEQRVQSRRHGGGHGICRAEFSRDRGSTLRLTHESSDPLGEPGRRRCVVGRENNERKHTMGRGLLLWLIGIPIPIILLVWLLGGLH